MNEVCLMFARDPGCSNCIEPLIERFCDAGYSVKVFAEGAALKRLKGAAANIWDYINEISEESILEFVKSENPKFIITGTSIGNFLSRYLWNAAKELGIASYAVMDQWMHYGIRFSKYLSGEDHLFENDQELKYLPSKIFVMDEVCKNEMLKDNFPEELLVISGHPYFETVLKRAQSIKYDEVAALREELLTDNDEKLIVFASEPLTKDFGGTDRVMSFLGYSEKTILRNFLEALKKQPVSSIVILRLHPRDDIENYEDLLNDYADIKILIRQDIDPHLLMKSADLIVGMSSMFLIEGMLLGVKVLSIQIGLVRENPFVFDRLGVLKSVLTQKQLDEKLADSFYGNRKYPFDISGHKDASINILKYILNEEEKR